MKNFILFVFFLFFLPGIYAQSDFPKNASEDKEKIMSDLYWEIWNDSVQACIDRDIEEYRKANATIELPEVNEGTEVKIEQVSHDFIFGASIFNFNQLGTEEHNQKYKDLFGILFNRATIPFIGKRLKQSRIDCGSKKSIGIQKYIGTNRVTLNQNHIGDVRLQILLSIFVSPKG